MTSFRIPLALASVLTVATAPLASAYTTLCAAWPTGTIPMTLQLDATKPASPVLPLQDGATSWNSVAQSAMADWNAVMTRSQFTSVTSSQTTVTSTDKVNSIAFGSTYYGYQFDSLTLAVTMVDHYDTDGTPIVRSAGADMVVNTAWTWNSYRGTHKASTQDLRRVVLHELGHVIGLDHPDQANPVQHVSAIMNSAVSDLEALQSDDRTGAASLYNTTLPTFSPKPVVTATAATPNAGGATVIRATVNGTPTADASPILGYTWYFKAKGATSYEKLFTETAATLDFGSSQVTDSGSYYVRIMTPDSTVETDPFTLTVNPVTTSPNTLLANLSTRGIAGSGSSTLTAGFVVTGSHAKQVLIRAVGPTLGAAPFNMSGTLPDPQLTLLKMTSTGSTTLATSPTIWDSSNGAALTATMNQVGAFPLSTGSKDAVLVATLAPGNYSAQVTSPSGATGIVLVEAYDADPQVNGAPDPSSRLTNLATRGYVGTGNNIMIAGFVVRGPGPKTYLIRVSGTTIAKNYGVTGTLLDPILTLFDNSTNAQIRRNDDWDTPASTQSTLAATFKQVGAFDFPYPSTTTGTDGVAHRDDSAMQPAMLVTLQPGNYTAQVSGNDNDNTTVPTGNVLIEIYEVP